MMHTQYDTMLRPNPRTSSQVAYLRVRRRMHGITAVAGLVLMAIWLGTALLSVGFAQIDLANEKGVAMLARRVFVPVMVLASAFPFGIWLSFVYRYEVRNALVKGVLSGDADTRIHTPLPHAVSPEDIAKVGRWGARLGSLIAFLLLRFSTAIPAREMLSVHGILLEAASVVLLVHAIGGAIAMLFLTQGIRQVLTPKRVSQALAERFLEKKKYYSN